jgi:hypothetical protein
MATKWQKESRGIRNNNPGNVKHGSKWKGLRVRQTDPVFCQFSDVKWGIRVIAYLIRKYQYQYGIDNILGFCERWAPESDDNPTGVYAIYLSNKLGVSPRKKIVFCEWPNILSLIEGIIFFENGVQPYSMDELKEGIRLAGIEIPHEGEK